MIWQKMTGALTGKQLKMVSLLLSGASRDQIARELEIGQRTVDRWLTKPALKLALVEAQEKMLDAIAEQCRGALTKALPKSIQRLIECLDAEDPRVRLRASELICKISGFYSPSASPNVDQARAELDFRRYIHSLETNGNGSHPANNT